MSAKTYCIIIVKIKLIHHWILILGDSIFLGLPYGFHRECYQSYTQKKSLEAAKKKKESASKIWHSNDIINYLPFFCSFSLKVIAKRSKNLTILLVNMKYNELNASTIQTTKVETLKASQKFIYYLCARKLCSPDENSKSRDITF